jgi:hypothetical protein
MNLLLVHHVFHGREGATMNGARAMLIDGRHVGRHAWRTMNRTIEKR